MRIYLPLLFLLCCIAAIAQPKYRVLNVPVTKSGIKMWEPWHGGMNAPQFSPINLNDDTLMDLFVFDRVSDKVYTYINKGGSSDTAYKYAPEYEILFPKELNNWALIRDYNYDGVPDIFCHGPLGIMAYKGKKDAGYLQFDVVSEVVSYTDNIYTINVWTNIDDIPVFTDVNRDGDIDILTFGLFGAAVEYYENQTQENIGNPSYVYDSLKYLLITPCWGGFTEAQMSNTINLNDSSCNGLKPEAGASGSRHMGSTLFDFDFDNDHDVDLLIGDISYPTLTFVQNCADSSWAHACYYDNQFPVCDTSVYLLVFPAAYGVDANNDGMQDLLIAPNARNGSEDVNNVHYYKNSGNTSCQFTYQSDTFLVQHILDYGTGSKPVIFDFDYNGLPDIVVSNYGYFRPAQTYQSKLGLLRNVGTATQPAFEQVSTDYFGISSYNLVNAHPAFGDLDGDGKQDMLMGELNGYFHFFKNTGGVMANFSVMTTPLYFNIDVGQYSTPFLFDINGDSLLDIVSGKRDGSLDYYRNMGTTTSPLFHKDSVTKNFGGININQPGYQYGNSVPFLQKNTNNEIELYVGAQSGMVFKYVVNADSVNKGPFTLVSSNYLGYDAGTNASMTIADFNADGKFEYLCGNELGGVIMYSDTLIDTTIVINVTQLSPSGTTLLAFPNPGSDKIWLKLSDAPLQTGFIEVINLHGQHIAVEVSYHNGMAELNTALLSAGVYLVRYTANQKTFSTRIAIAR
ncbi:MAG: T9SS type A sorting domain-containing protein [Chitinophagales bacterium]|nr:T9SS type A sorting domain-containing protein [Chitinophagales bacterium]